MKIRAVNLQKNGNFSVVYWDGALKKVSLRKAVELIKKTFVKERQEVFTVLESEGASTTAEDFANICLMPFVDKEVPEGFVRAIELRPMDLTDFEIEPISAITL